jgi:hypothetical protein
MPRHIVVFAAFALALIGCGGKTPVAQAPSPSAARTSSPPPSEPASSPTASRNPPAPPSSNVKDCFDADCTLVLSKPAKIPLDAKRFHYSSMRVTAISAQSLTFTVDYPQGGGSSSTIGPGLANGSFGFRGSPLIEVGLTLVDGNPALVLQPGDVA